MKIKYKGKNFLYVGGYKIKSGWNELSDDDFYLLMKTKLFKFRVDQNILEVEPGFPIDALKTEKVADMFYEDVLSENLQDEKNILSVKAVLKTIAKSESLEFLQNILDTDTRSKIQEEAKNKINSLK